MNEKNILELLRNQRDIEDDQPMLTASNYELEKNREE